MLGLRLENPLGTHRSHRHRPLHQYVQLARQRGKNVRLVQVIGRADQQCIELLVVHQLGDVGVRGRDVEAIGEGARLGQVVVADPDHLDVLGALERRQMTHLRDRARTDNPQPQSFRHRPATPSGQ